MLFDASTTYAPGEPHGNVGYSQYQNVNILGRFHLDQVLQPNVVLGLAGLAAVVVLLHKFGGR